MKPRLLTRVRVIRDQNGNIIAISPIEPTSSQRPSRRERGLAPDGKPWGDEVPLSTRRLY